MAKTKEQSREEILGLVKEYYNNFHANNKPFTRGDRITYAARVYDDREMTNLIDSSLEFWLTSGRYTDEFEQSLAEYLNVKYCSLVNSGSSANLLAFMALTSPTLGERAIRRGDEVITVAAGFPTTVAPIMQFGAVPVFVDVTIPQYNIDIAQMRKALSPKTKAVMLAHTLGNPFDIAEVVSFCKANKLWLIEDNCDALGSTYSLGGQVRKTGSFGDIGTSSFYPPHHMTMGEGGAVYTSDSTLNKIVRSLRDWGRDCVCPSGVDNVCKHRFDKRFAQLPYGYDHKYVYSHFGYNLKATDMQAAVGVAQLDKLPEFVDKRKANWQYLHKGLEGVKGLTLPSKVPNSDPSWFGFMITVDNQVITREKIVSALEKNNIQTRNLFAGNLLRHPCFDSIREDKSAYRVVGKLTNSDTIMNDSFWIGVYPGLTKDMLEHMIATIKSAK